MVSSQLGQGTTFKFILPYKKGNASLVAKGKNKDGLLYPQKEMVKDMRILVFEDNILNQRLIDQRLKSWGCITYITDNPLYGLNILKNNRVDLVLMDLRMPGMDGYQVTQRIRTMEDIDVEQVPIIALTADFSVSDKKKCDEYGINDFVLKPYSPEELLSKLIKNGRRGHRSAPVAPQVIDSIPLPVKEIDLSAVLAECMGEIDILEELVQLFRQNALEFIGRTKFHLRNKDYEGLVFASHKMKPGLAMMKAARLHSCVRQIHERARKEANMEEIEALYSAFLEEYPRVEQAILDAVAKLRRKY
jgi:CheY-like chemotaxis protein